MAHTRQFSNDEMIQQIFPFKAPIIKYIFDKINFKHLYKLYQCCKYFPNKFPLIIIHQIQDVTYIGQYVIYNNQPVALENNSNIWVSDDIRLHNHNIRKWISNMWICTIKCLILYRQDLSLSEFQMLTHSGNVEELFIEKIVEKNGTCLSVEEIVSYVPKAGRIGISYPRITSETFMKLANMERKCKISWFSLDTVNVEINSNEFLKFIEVHASKDESVFSFGFDSVIPEDYVKDLKNTIKCKVFYGKEFKCFTLKPSIDASVLRC